MRVLRSRGSLGAWVAALALACAAGGVACGGAGYEPKSAPSSPGTGAPPHDAVQSTSQPKNEAGDKMLEAGTVQRAQRDFDDAAGAVETSGDDCAQLCKALSSMSRAAERLCELAKDGGTDGQQRCSDARAKVEAARARVRTKCPVCDG